MPLSQNARGALMMTLAMGVFTTNDALVKSVTPFMSVGQIMMIRGAMTTAMLLVIAWRMGALAHVRRMAHPLLLMRSIFEIAGTVTYVTALGSIQLANAGAIMQFIPLAVTLGASLFFGEQVGWRRWLAILIGFIGVMIILRPTPSGFSFASLLVVLTVFLTAGRDLTTRRLGLALPALLVSLFAAVTNTVVGGLLILPMGGWHPVSLEQFGRLALASVLLLMGYQSIILAMREGDVSFVAPFRYTSLIFALGLGYLAFDERPDGLMVLGSCLIIASGLYAFYRERRRAQSIAAETSAGTASG